MRINKTTTIGTVAAAAVIGATSPVWADSGTDSAATELSPSQQAAVISTLRAEIAKLKAEIKADEAALHAATKAARMQAHELHKARVAAAHRTHPATNTVPVQAPVTSPAQFDDREAGDDQGEDKDFDHHDGRHGKDCDDHDGDRGEFSGRDFDDDDDFGDRGDRDDDGDHGDFDDDDGGDDD